MRVIQRATPPPHIIVPDSNALWHSDKSYAANPDFDQVWGAHAESIHLELVVPDVVRNELLFQQVTSATKCLEKAKAALVDYGGITKKEAPLRLSASETRSSVEAKFDRWLREKNGSVKATPISSIDWSDLVERSCWRLAPFVYDPKNPSEKGLRDALIVETLCDLAARDHRQTVQIVFVSEDDVARDYAKKRLRGDSRCVFLEKPADLDSYLKLVRERLTNQFISQIRHRARAKFFASKDVSCLYYSWDIMKQLDEKFGEILASPAEESTLLRSRYEYAGSRHYWIEPPLFQRLEGSNVYFWRSVICVAGVYRYRRSPFLLGDFSPFKVIECNFAVDWNALVWSDGRFRRTDLKEISFINNRVFDATPEKLSERKVGLPQDSAPS